MISEHESVAFKHPRILEFHKFYSEFQFWLEAGLERFKMAIRIYETNDGRFYFVQSHFVQTPLRALTGSPDQTPRHDTPHNALFEGLAAVTTFYDEAVGAGHDPRPEWFVPNAGFNPQ